MLSLRRETSKEKRFKEISGRKTRILQIGEETKQGGRMRRFQTNKSMDKEPLHCTIWQSRGSLSMDFMRLYREPNCSFEV